MISCIFCILYVLYFASLLSNLLTCNPNIFPDGVKFNMNNLFAFDEYMNLLKSIVIF